MSLLSYYKFSRSEFKKGFSLVELLMVLVIVITISTVVLLEYPNFGTKASLQIVSQEIALTIREAQIYGISVKEAGGSFDNYGVHIDSGDQNEIIFYADTSGDGFYSAGTDLVVKRYIIADPNYVANVCINKTGRNPSPPNEDREKCSESDYTIAFTRPEPEPGVHSSSEFNAQYLRIHLAGPAGEKHIFVWSTGQISVVDQSEATYISEPITCLLKGSKVVTPSGDKRIEDLKKGDLVVGYDLERKQEAILSVKNQLSSFSDSYYVINGSFNLTKEHPVAVVVAGDVIWKKVAELSVGDLMVGSEQKNTKVESLEIVELDEPIEVFNPEMTHPNTYYVVGDGDYVLVHNKGGK